MSRPLDAMLTRLRAIGIRIVLPLGSEHGATLGALAPWARGGLLLLSGGPTFFEAFQKARHLYTDRDDPLDDWTRDQVEPCVEELKASGYSATARYPFWNEPDPVSFLQLGRLAGLTATAPFGLCLHPDHGSFIAFRALILLDRAPPDEFTTGALPPGWDPCPSCAAPCIPACPPGAVTSQGWALSTCVDHRALDESCEAGCLSRLACPVGGDARPSPEALRFHQAASRRWITNRRNPRGTG